MFTDGSFYSVIIDLKIWILLDNWIKSRIKNLKKNNILVHLHCNSWFNPPRPDFLFYGAMPGDSKHRSFSILQKPFGIFIFAVNKYASLFFISTFSAKIFPCSFFIRANRSHLSDFSYVCLFTKVMKSKRDFLKIPFLKICNFSVFALGFKL